MKSRQSGGALKMPDKTEQSDRAPNPIRNRKVVTADPACAYPAIRDGWLAGARKQSGLAGMLTLGR